jgi:hypothetical protein
MNQVVSPAVHRHKAMVIVMVMVRLGEVAVQNEAVSC